MTRRLLGRIGGPLIGLALFAQTASVPAQTPPPARVPPSARENSPLALPGDNPPPPVAAMAAPPHPQPAVRPAPPAPPPQIAGPGADLALEAAQAALERCRTEGLNVGVAVSDSGGNLLVGLTMDGTVPGRIYNAARKNLVAIAFKTPTSMVQARLRAGDADALARITPAMTVFPGALPLLAGDRVFGAIGISGQAGGKDELCAAAGVAAIAARLK